MGSSPIVKHLDANIFPNAFHHVIAADCTKFLRPISAATLQTTSSLLKRNPNPREGSKGPIGGIEVVE